MNKKGGFIAEILGTIVLVLGGFIAGHFFGDAIISIIKGWLGGGS